MSVAAINTIHQPYAIASNAASYAAVASSQPMPFSTENLSALTPPLPIPVSDNGGLFWNKVAHPFKSSQVNQLLQINPNQAEPFGFRQAMYQTLNRNLSDVGQQRLEVLLREGRLTDLRSQDKHSTLAHLYSIATTARANGLYPQAVLEDTVRILAAPQAITQQPGDLNARNQSLLLNYYNSGSGPRLSTPVTPAMLHVTSSATCVSSSLMDDMANHSPAEFTRQIAQLTGPQQAFYQTVSGQDISPDDPAQGAQVLAQYEIPHTLTTAANGTTKYGIWVNLPYTGLLLAQNQQQSPQPGTRGIVETAYQSALTHLVARNYDPGLDMRISADGTLDENKGLEADRVAIMESIVANQGPVIPVTYQLTVSKPNDPNDAFLMGYTRNFEQTTNDLIRVLNSGKSAEIGITDTEAKGDQPGRIDMGHELRVEGYRRNPQTGDIIFKIFDSDDNNENWVERYATELVPKIHHIDLPLAQARQVKAEMAQLPDNQWLVPDQQEGRRYQLINTIPLQDQQRVMQDYQQMLQQQPAESTAAAPTAPIAPVPAPPHSAQPAAYYYYIPQNQYQAAAAPFMPAMPNYGYPYANAASSNTLGNTFQAAA